MFLEFLHFKRKGRLRKIKKNDIRLLTQKKRGGALCVEMGFTWTFPRNQEGTVKLKSEIICIKF